MTKRKRTDTITNGGGIAIEVIQQNGFCGHGLRKYHRLRYFSCQWPVITIAGSWTPLAYLLGGLVMMMEVAFIIEMTIANPVSGSFKVYAQEVFGEWWGFVVGWMFWASGVLGMASEVTACAIFARLWFPHIPLWILSLVFALSITLINFNDVKGLSKIELGLSITKVLTLVLFILLGIFLAFGFHVGTATEHFTAFWSSPKNSVENLTGVLSSLLLIFFAYTGTGIIGLAAVVDDLRIRKSRSRQQH